MKAAATRAVRQAARLLTDPIPVAAWRRIFPKQAVGFCYHMVTDTRLPHLKHYAPIGTARFEADLAYIKDRFTCVGYGELVQRRARGDDRGTAIITVDDGFAQSATVIAPLLRRAQLPGVFFVVTDLLDNREMFRETKAALCLDAIEALAAEDVLAVVDRLGLAGRLPPPPVGPGRTRLDMADLGYTPDARLLPLVLWLLGLQADELPLLDRLCEALGVDTGRYLEAAQPYLTTAQLLDLMAQGCTIGAHTLSHRLLQDLPLAEAEREIVESCRIVHELTGQPSVPFAFPYTGAGYDRGWLRSLREKHDFIGLMFSTEGVVNDAPFMVQRVFGEDFEGVQSLDLRLRRAWAHPAAWRRARVSQHPR